MLKIHVGLCFSCVSGGEKDEKGVTAPRSAVVFGTCRPAGLLPPAPCLAASHLHIQVRSSYFHFRSKAVNRGINVVCNFFSFLRESAGTAKLSSPAAAPESG